MSNRSSLSASTKLQVGAPQEQPATFTRFVLPFAYLPCNWSRQGPTAKAPHYRPLQTLPGLGDRRRYLTSETAEVLFERAMWLELVVPKNSAVDGLLNFTASFESGETHAIRIDRPRLVLFEYGSGKKVAAANDRVTADILRTGFLCLDVWFPETALEGTQPSVGNLLELNELFRFWQCPWRGHGVEKGYLTLLNEHLAALSLDAADPLRQDPYVERWARLLEYPVCAQTRQGTEEWFHLFPKEWARSAREWALADRPRDFPGSLAAGLRSERKEVQSELSRLRRICGDKAPTTGWIVHADDRAFVWTCAVLPKAEEPVANETTKAKLRGPWNLSSWVQLLNVDKPGDAPPSGFERKWAKARTYARWWHTGTAYGFCSHAGAMLSVACPEPPYWRHYARMYFDQVLLLLYVRVGTFRFSRRLSEVSAAARGKGPKDVQDLAEQFQDLRFSFALFTNLYQFPLLSSQQQAVEMYSLARRHLDVEELFEEVQAEIHATDDFLNGKDQLDQTRAANRLGVIAGVAAVIGLTLTLHQIGPWEQTLPAPSALWLSLGLWLVPFAAILFVVALFSRGLGNRLSRAEDGLRKWARSARGPQAR